MGACHPSPMGGRARRIGTERRDFHVRRSARDRYGIDDVLLGIRGDLDVADLAAIRLLAQRMNEERAPEAPGVAAGEIGALGLLHEIGHLLVARYDRRRRPDDGDRDARGAPPAARRPRPPARSVRGRVPGCRRRSPSRPSTASRSCCSPESATRTRRSARCASWSTTGCWPRGRATHEAIDGLEQTLRRERPRSGGRSGVSLVELLRAPARHAPTSLAGQLRYIRDHWGGLLGAALDALLGRLDIAIGILAEEERALHLRFGGGRRAARRPHAVVPRPRRRARGASPSTRPGCPGVVLMAKSTYVWLDQLSRRYGRDIRTLDAIPDEELDTLAALGRHRAVADRPVAAVGGLGADQADARQPGRGRLGLLARRLPDRRRPRRRGRLRRPARARLGARHPAGQRHGAQPHGHRLALGHRPSRVVPVAAPSRPTRPTPSAAPTSRRTSAVGVVLEDHYWDDTRRRGRRSSASTGRAATSATSTTATTARASRGTTRPSSTS